MGRLVLVRPPFLQRLFLLLQFLELALGGGIGIDIGAHFHFTFPAQLLVDQGLNVKVSNGDDLTHGASALLVMV